MPLKIREVPPRVMETFQSAIGQGMSEAFTIMAPGPRALADLPPPHPVYYLSLLAIANGSGLQGAVQTGWRQVADVRGEIHAIRLDVIGGRVFNLCGEHMIGEREQRVFDVRRVETALSAEQPTFEFRKLWIPPMISSALWLSTPDPAQDLIIPVESTLSNLAAEQTYNANQLLAQLRDIAVELLETMPELPRAESQ